MAIIKLNNNALTSVTELPSGVGSDPNLKIDVARLGLRIFANQNLVKQNSVSSSYDVFQNSDGITNLTNASRNASGEYISTATISYTIGGSDEGFITGDNYWQTISNFKFTSNNNQASNWQHNVNNLFDGATGNNPSDSTWPGATTTDSVYLDITPTSTYQSGGTKVISGVRFKVASRNQSVAFSLAGSNTLGGTYTTLGSGTMGTGGDYDITYVPTQTYDYYRITFPNGVNTSGYWNELYGNRRSVSESTTLNASGSFEGVSITASSTNKMGAVVTYKNESGTNALNSDLVLKLSADNGSNYSTATLVDNGNLDSTTKVASVSDLSVTAGTQLKYKIEFANQSSGSKECRVTGVSLQY